MMAVCVLEMLGDEDAKPRRGRMLGSKNVRRTGKKVENLWAELGCYARKAYRMSMEAFDVLHDTIKDALEEEFKSKDGDRDRGVSLNGDIPTKLRLSTALHVFAGGAVYDTMLTHGMGKSSVY